MPNPLNYLRTRPKACPHCKAKGSQMYFENHIEGATWTCLPCGGVVYVGRRGKRPWVPRLRGRGAKARSSGVQL